MKDTSKMESGILQVETYYLKKNEIIQNKDKYID